jgi:transcriptional regulator with XRE-family HTH domain
MDDDTYKLEVRRRFRVAIEAIGETQVAVARELNVSPTKLGNWIRGDNYPPHRFIKRFCDRYGVSTEWILRGVVSELPSGLAKAIWRADQASQVDRQAGQRQEA